MEKVNMGIGELGEPGLVFIRQFRFLIDSQHLSSAFNHSVHIDWSNKMIRLTVYEVFKDGVIPVHQWADAMEKGEYPNESFNLMTLDGCGNEIYKKRFTGLTIRNRSNEFSYEKSDVSFHTMLISYDECHDEPTSKNKTTEIKKTNDAAPINHLNAKCWVN